MNINWFAAFIILTAALVAKDMLTEIADVAGSRVLGDPDDEEGRATWKDVAWTVFINSVAIAGLAWVAWDVSQPHR